MTFKASYLLIFFSSLNFICSQDIPSNQSYQDPSFFEIATAILKNKNTLSDSISTLSTFANWKGSFNNLDDFFTFPYQEGLVTEYWELNFNPTVTWSFSLIFFDSNYTDKTGIVISINTGFDSPVQVQINEANATIQVSSLTLYAFDYPDQETLHSCNDSELYIYFLEKSTQKPPQKFDTLNLHAYTKQFRIVSTDKHCNFELATSIFDDHYYVSQQDKLIFIIGSLVFLCASLLSIYRNKRKASNGSLRFLAFFSFYVISYLIMWLKNVNMISDLLYFFIPFAITVSIDLVKHCLELYKYDEFYFGCFVFGPLAAFMLVIIRPFGLYLGDFLSCIYLLPQVLLKYKERHERRKHVTWFEVGNWICISLWVLYLDFYPTNVFLSSPKATIAFRYLVIILIQLGILVYLQYAVPKKKLFRYTFAVKDVKDHENLLLDQCAICLSGLGINTEEKLYKTPCGHLFHSDCLKEWGDKRLECPYCRTKIPDFVYPLE